MQVKTLKLSLEIRNLQRQAELNELRSNYVKGGILDF